MKKKTYQQPQAEIMEAKPANIILSTSQFPNPQNESYDEVDESVTDGWY